MPCKFRCIKGESWGSELALPGVGVGPPSRCGRLGTHQSEADSISWSGWFPTMWSMISRLQLGLGQGRERWRVKGRGSWHLPFPENCPGPIAHTSTRPLVVVVNRIVPATLWSFLSPLGLQGPSGFQTPHLPLSPHPGGHSQLGQEGVHEQGGLKAWQEAASVADLLHQRVCGVPVLWRSGVGWPEPREPSLHTPSLQGAHPRPWEGEPRADCPRTGLARREEGEDRRGQNSPSAAPRTSPSRTCPLPPRAPAPPWRHAPELSGGHKGLPQHCFLPAFAPGLGPSPFGKEEN